MLIMGMYSDDETTCVMLYELMNVMTAAVSCGEAGLDSGREADFLIEHFYWGWREWVEVVRPANNTNRCMSLARMI